MFYHGGAFSLESALNWAVGGRGEEEIEPDLQDLERGFAGMPLIEADDRAVADIPFFNDWVRHLPQSDFWRVVDGTERIRNLVAPALLMAGWYDPFLPAQLDDFVRIKRDARPEIAAASRLIVGPWAHARTVTLPEGDQAANYRIESFAPSIPWFDRHLRAVETRPKRRLKYSSRAKIAGATSKSGRSGAPATTHSSCAAPAKPTAFWATLSYPCRRRRPTNRRIASSTIRCDRCRPPAA